MKATLISLATVLLLLASCSREKNPGVRHYQARGIVRSIAPDRSTIEVEHENIPGFMPSMTMPFTPRAKADFANLRLNDAIAFRVDVADNDYSIADVKKINASEVHLPKSAPTPMPRSNVVSARLKEGDVMPVFSLTDEQGEHISLDMYRGRPLVLTFIFTRCPIPNFCPRISNNFAKLQDAIQNAAGTLAQTRLLSITLDPQFDTPAILRQYGAHAAANPSIWHFGTGDPPEIDALTTAFAVYRQNEGGTISHGLVTALIDGAGSIVKIWRGNSWAVTEVTRAITEGQNPGTDYSE